MHESQTKGRFHKKFATSPLSHAIRMRTKQSDLAAKQQVINIKKNKKQKHKQKINKKPVYQIIKISKNKTKKK